MADEWMERARLINVTSIEQVEDMAFARESRLGLRKVRSKIEHLRAEMKKDLVKRGKDIDGTAGALEDKILPVEAHLREQEEFAIRYEAARLTGIREARAAELVALGTDPKLYTDLAAVSDDGYAQILAIARAAHDAKAEAARLAEVARLEAERIAAEAREAARAEKARLDAGRLERERVQAEENARLRAEAAERNRVWEEHEAALRAERAERARQDAIREEALRIEREAAAAIAKAEREERDRERQRAEAQARIEREKIEEQARKSQADHDALRRRIAEQEHRAKLEAAAEKERAEALAEEQRQKPDREKLLGLAGLLLALANGKEVTIRLPTLSTPEGIESGAKVRDQIAKLAAGTRRLGGAK
jgi:hypothetical protein